jgi:hypothetical protein
VEDVTNVYCLVSNDVGLRMLPCQMNWVAQIRDYENAYLFFTLL